MSDEAEEVQGVGMVRLRRQDLAVKGFGICQPPGLVMLKRQLQRLWNGHGARMKDEG